MKKEKTSNDKVETWRMRNICRQTIQEFWFQNKELKDVMNVYGLCKYDNCYTHVEKLLLKTRNDFINGFSFFNRDDVDEKIISLMERYGCSCMKD